MEFASLWKCLSTEGNATKDSVHIHVSVRFVTGFLGRGEEEKKKHKAVNSGNFNAPGRKFKKMKTRNLNFLIFSYLAFRSQ